MIKAMAFMSVMLVIIYSIFSYIASHMWVVFQF